MRKVGVVGAGAFGTALAISVASQNNNVILWGRSQAQMKEIKYLNENSRFLPNIKFPNELIPTSDLDALALCEVVLLAIPTQSLREFLEAHKTKLENLPLVACCKGAELETGDFPTEIIQRYLPRNNIMVLTGPGFAQELAQGKPTAMTLGSTVPTADFQKILSSKTLRLYQSNDLIGLQIGGAVKNVIAIACGIAMGAGLGESARAALMTRGFAEMIRFAKVRGGNQNTLMGLSGFGDLSLTCSSKKSRNYSYGYALSQGDLIKYSDTVEGSETSHVIAKFGNDFDIEMPITQMVSKVIKQEISSAQAMEHLLARPLREDES